MKNAGRWTDGSTSWNTYIVSGLLESEIATHEGREDPLRKMWVWHPTSLLRDLHRDLKVGSSSA